MIKQDTSQLDDLTGFYVRRIFPEHFSRLLEQARSSPGDKPLSIAMFDLDHFKAINDNFGHVVGDNWLVAITNCVTEQIGDQAIGFRYGGDEFILLMPGIEREQAFLLAERLRQAVSLMTITMDDGRSILSQTTSIGVASFPVDGRTAVELVRKADHALYRAKVGGGNQVRLAFEERMVPKTAHFTQTQLERLTRLANERSVSEADLLREAMDDLLTKYGVNDIES